MLKEKGLTQEWLKIIACVTMLIDHIGATLVPMMELRLIGRLSFPIFCFLLAEGMAHTRNVKKYGIRLAVGALLAEVPFDLALYGGLTWGHQSVMVTLLIGYLMTLWIRRTERGQLVPVIVCAVAAELVSADYGAMGVSVIGMFVLTRNMAGRVTAQTLALGALCWFMGGYGWNIGTVFIPAQMLAVLAMVPIGLYSGRKATTSRVVQWGFYLFYPVHLLILSIL